MSTLAPLNKSEPERALEPTQPSTFCMAIYFYYACGCRTPEPSVCCRPRLDNSSSSESLGSRSPPKTVHENPCQHNTPSIVVAKLPHACKVGKTEACGAIDPSLLEFRREADTAERLDLTILNDIPREEIDRVLPDRVYGEFTTNEVAGRFLDKSEHSSAFALNVPPIVSESCATTPAEEMLSEDEDSESSGQFVDVDLATPTSVYTVGGISTPREETVELEEPSALATDSYDDMLTFYSLTLDNKTSRQVTKTSGWGISSLFGFSKDNQCF